jgi:ATP-dependent RNA helicase DDX18/HAS1
LTGFDFTLYRELIEFFVKFLVTLQKVAASFCFRNPPKVNLDLDSSAAKHRKKMRRVDGGKRHGISASNPYGRKDKDGGDKQQFARF